MAEARARHDAAVEEMRAYFDAEVGALRSELREAYAMMEYLRTLNAFARYERSETNAITRAGPDVGLATFVQMRSSSATIF